jgi:protein gp37
MNKTKIDWADYSWNPIKGLCPEACWYCYGRAIYKRFKLDERLEFHATRGDVAKMYRIHPSRIFICSTIEMFHPKVETAWRDKIFYTIEKFPEHTFIILTKRPENIDRPMPDNVWLGVSVTGFDDYARKGPLMKKVAKVRFASYEPMLAALPVEFFHGLDWAILGRLTGHGRKHDPSPMSLEVYKSQIREMGVPLFMKNNLAGIRPGPLIQEYPR